MAFSVFLCCFELLSSMNLWNHCAPLHCCLWLFFIDNKTESPARGTAELTAIFWTLLCLPAIKMDNSDGVVLKDSVKEALSLFEILFFFFSFFSPHKLHILQLSLQGKESSYEQESPLCNSESSSTYCPTWPGSLWVGRLKCTAV